MVNDLNAIALDAKGAHAIAIDLMNAPAGAKVSVSPAALATLYATIARLLERVEALESSDSNDPNDGERKLKVVGG